MMQSHTCQFKVVTALPDLARREIRQIVVELKELHVVDRCGEMVAQGTIWRELRYLEKGRLRKANDLIQFETVLAENQQGVAAFVKAELKPEWYLFQGVPSLGGQPVLEQAFSLTFWWVEPQPEPEGCQPEAAMYQTLTLNRILSRGLAARMVKIPVCLPENEGEPRQCQAELHVDPTPAGALVTGVLKGYIGYGKQIYRETGFEQDISLIINELSDGLGVCAGLTGSVTEVSWRPGEVNKNIWIFNVKVELTWYLAQEEALECLMPSPEGLEAAVPIRICQRRSPIYLQFERIWTLPGLQGQPGEVKAVVKQKKEVYTKGGMLLTAKIGIEMFYDHPDGMEAYQEWEVEFNELVTEGIGVTVDREFAIQANVGVELANVLPGAGQLQVESTISYEITLVKDQEVQVVVNPASACAIVAKVRLDGRKFTAPGEARFKLRSQPQRVEAVQTEISNLQFTSGPGWLKVGGQLDVAVMYGDWARYGRMDLFSHTFQEDFVWEGLQPAAEIESKAELLFDSYEMVDGQLVYRYLLELRPESFRQKELNIAVRQTDNRGAEKPLSIREVTLPKPVTFWTEQEIALCSGPVAEIAAERTRVVQFRCEDVGKALLVEGRIDSELEYWDRNGFLRRESLNLPFWNFVPHEWPGRIEPDRFVPQIKKCAYQLLGAWPWQKSSVKLSVEIELVCAGGEGNDSKGYDAKPD